MNNHRLLLIVCYFVFVVIVFPWFNRSKVFSVFSAVSPEMNTLIEEVRAQQRTWHSRQYLTSKHPASSLTLHSARLASPQLEHLVVVIARNVDDFNPGRSRYLMQLATSLDAMTEGDNDTAMILCDASTKFNPILDALASYYPRFKVNTTAANSSREKFNSDSDKLKIIFLDCLNLGISVSNSPKLVTIFNEYVLPYKNFDRDVREIVRTKLDNRMSSGESLPNPDSWLYLHLQEPVPLRLFQSDFETFRELVLISLAGSVLFYTMFKYLDPHMNSGSVLFTTVYGAVFFMTCALCIGRPYITELRRVVPCLYRLYDPPEAVLFSALTLPPSSFRLMEPHLRAISCSQYVAFHHVLDSLINTLEVPGYVVSPSLVRYV